MHNPFLGAPAQQPGHGTAHLALLPPSTPIFQTLKYQYPLKLIAPTPLGISVPYAPSTSTTTTTTTNIPETAITKPRKDILVHTLYILTYGGGLVSGDSITLSLTLAAHTRLILLTQGSTKVFKATSRDVLTAQRTNVRVEAGAGLVFLPDPVQPFERSVFAQEQVFEMLPVRGGEKEGEAQRRGSLCVLDWVSCGRAARGEHWGVWRYGSRNEIYLLSEHEDANGQQGKRLLLRDNLVLDVDAEEQDVGGVAARMDGMGVFGTLILYGPLFEALGRFFMDEFKRLPRIGGSKWDSGSGDEEEVTEAEVRRIVRQRQETADGLLWSAASVRGCVVVKFGAREVEGGRKWVRSMLESEGSVVEQFGERAMMCLR